ncbi:MAG: efflux RND transporter periplasmic adaptor subunit [Granulosicoccaceae bacterium]|jgi:Cu(I)/Ag(I) efflux system membrane fusion protein
MKSLKLIIPLLATFTLVACGDGGSGDVGKAVMQDMPEQTAVEHAAKHLDPKYVCPMHPNIVQDEPGNCPICGMDLVPLEQDTADSGGERKLLYYKHPHDPGITSDVPMKDSMGMDYVPVYDDGGGASVKVSPAIVQNLGVRTAKAERGRLWKRIDTVGYVDFDENMISHVHLRTEGWIEKLMVKSQGERVKKGQLLFELYSPTLVNAQDEYIQALASRSKRLINASRERLLSLGIDASQISKLEKTRKTEQRVRIYARQDGIVSHLAAREGMFVKPRMEVMTLADLSSIWIQVEVFERQAEWVKVGKPAEMTVSYLPGRVWEGTVEYVYPSLDPKTRTLRARLKFANPDEALKPNMFATVTIYGGAERDVVSIPREALIRTGTEQRVILSLGDGRFAPRSVVSGIESGDRIEIKRGLEGGENVVVSSQFLLDSEASVRASLMRMTDPGKNTDSGMPMAKPIVGTGVMRELMPEQGKVNMSHDPIPALGWPDMTMDFRLAEGVSLEGIRPDMAVEFDLEEREDAYVITGIRPRQHMDH